ncbi:kinesin-like protein KIF20A [Rhopalosiphum maidis]|uniref:kinesin-like protein KIF20A n=1 Tax=Rhopalosiphum maidis TaxID=43146 RepID=UPI000EFF9F29|nr:kinesin-like protein KIF20A [Rhopalosiphum maidis]
MNDSKDHHSTGSYVEPRVPSITGFGQRKINGKPKKVLDYSLEKCNDHSGVPKIDVCLRLKPRINSVPTGLDTLTILSDNIVACNNGNARDDVTEYTFSSVFGPNVDQKKFFDTWVYDKVLRFLNGNNELLFAYGTTNAGKTFTIHGNINDPGMIPRTLLLVFNSLNKKLMSQCKYKPDKVIAAHILDEKLIEYEEDIRNNILNNWCNEKTQDDLKSCMSHLDEGQTIHSIDQLNNQSIIKMFDYLKNDGIASLDHGNVSYTVWVSYSEIYNESIYDLLITYSANQKRAPLKLSLDQNKNVYVKNLTHVFVQSAEEAYKVMSFGRNNLRIASNNLNKSSSRSHCIFTLKLMRVENIENPKTAVISSISFCDLAGSERLKKTMNIGDRLTESKNINTSLLVLNKCFSVLRENQKRGENHLVPYRESKLTQMFQTALTGNTRTGISMAVNVDMSPSLLEETKQVLFMSAIVRAINKTKSKPISKPRPSFAIWAANNRKSLKQATSKQSPIIEDENSISESKYEHKSVMSNEDFEAKFKERESILRKELLQQFHSILNNNNAFHNKQKETMIKNKTEMYENKIKRLKAYYIEEIRERDEKLALHSNPNLTNNYENNKNKSEMENYEFRIGELEIQKEELLAEINELKNIHDLRKEDIDAKNREIENYKAMLDEANTEYEQMENVIDEMNNKFDMLYQELEEKNLEIERLSGSLEAKDNCITEMELLQEERITEVAEQKILKYMDEKIETIVGLENTIMKLKTKNKKYNEEKSNMAKQYQALKQQYLQMSKATEESSNTNQSVLLSKITDKDSKIAKLQDHVQKLEYELKDNENKVNELQTTIDNLKTASVRPSTKSIGVVTTLSNIQIPLKTNDLLEDKENMLSKSENRPQRRCKNTTLSTIKKTKKLKIEGTPDSSDKKLDEAIANIPISTRKRKLFDNKPPLIDSSNIPSDNSMNSVLSPARALHQVSKLRVKQ